jgi:hypothetical protein
MVVRLSALCADRPLPPGRFLVLISVTGWVDPRVIVRLEELDKLKKKIHLIGTRSRDFPTCSIVPQPTTLPRSGLFPSHFSTKILYAFLLSPFVLQSLPTSSSLNHFILHVKKYGSCLISTWQDAKFMNVYSHYIKRHSVIKYLKLARRWQLCAETCRQCSSKWWENTCCMTQKLHISTNCT